MCKRIACGEVWLRLDGQGRVIHSRPSMWPHAGVTADLLHTSKPSTPSSAPGPSGHRRSSRIIRRPSLRSQSIQKYFPDQGSSASGDFQGWGAESATSSKTTVSKVRVASDVNDATPIVTWRAPDERTEHTITQVCLCLCLCVGVSVCLCQESAFAFVSLCLYVCHCPHVCVGVALFLFLLSASASVSVSVGDGARACAQSRTLA